MQQQQQQQVEVENWLSIVGEMQSLKFISCADFQLRTNNKNH